MMTKIQSWFFFNDDKKGHTKALDGLRGIAVILVLLSHASNNNMLFHPWLAFNGIGKGGVYLFYVLSAYLLDRQISLALMNQTADAFFWKRYFLRRLFRIYPLFIIALFVFLGLSTTGIITVIENGKDVIRHIFLLEGKEVFWSVPVEFKYYFLSPFILLISHYIIKWNLRYVLIFFLLMSMTTLLMDFYFHLDRISTLKYLPVFLMGTFLAIYNLKAWTSSKSSSWSRAIGYAGLAALIFSIVMNPNYLGDWMGIDTSNNGRKVMLLYAMLCGIMLFAALNTEGLFRRVMELKILRFVGIISFSVYLFHMPVMYFMKSDIILIPQGLKIYIFFSTTIMVSILTFLLIERPILRIRITRPVVGPEKTQ